MRPDLPFRDHVSEIPRSRRSSKPGFSDHLLSPSRSARLIDPFAASEKPQILLPFFRNIINRVDLIARRCGACVKSGSQIENSIPVKNLLPPMERNPFQTVEGARDLTVNGAGGIGVITEVYGKKASFLK